MMTMVLRVAAVIGMGMLASFGSLFLKKATKDGLSPKVLIIQPSLYIGGLLYVASALLNFYLLKLYPLSFVVPLGALTYIWTLIISRIILKEPVGVRKIVGVCVIVLGVVIIAQGR